MRLYRQAASLGMPTTIIKDAGHTEVAPGTATVFAVAGSFLRLFSSLSRCCLKGEKKKEKRNLIDVM